MAAWSSCGPTSSTSPTAVRPTPPTGATTRAVTGGGTRSASTTRTILANAYLSQGNLVISARTDNVAGLSCWYGQCLYTSARLLSQGHFSQAYGRFEARAKLPSGQGMWPAFWMLGDNITQVNWPACGEIDVMENIGSEPATNHGSLHGPTVDGSTTDTNITATYTIDAGTLSDDFHIYSVEWEPNVVRFYVDGVLYETRTPADDPPGRRGCTTTLTSCS